MISFILIGFVMGIVFGLALEKGRVFEPGMIIGQLQLRNFIMLKMFLSAIATSLVVISVLYSLGLVDLHIKSLNLLGIVAGGVLFGVGMALAGACPGTVMAQVGAGYKDAWAIVAGGILAGVVFGYAEPTIAAWSTSHGPVTVMSLTGIPFLGLALLFSVLIIVGLYFIEKRKSWRDELGNDGDGVFDSTEEENLDS